MHLPLACGEWSVCSIIYVVQCACPFIFCKAANPYFANTIYLARVCGSHSLLKTLFGTLVLGRVS